MSKKENQQSITQKQYSLTIEGQEVPVTEEVYRAYTYLGHDSLYETEKYLKYSGDYFEDTLTKFTAFSGDLFPEVNFDE